jgi:LysM repeat protein
MSAAAAWDLNATPARVPARPTRPRLVLVPTGEAVVAPAKGPLRLTRAGRLTITLALTALLLGAALLALVTTAGATTAPHADHAVTVVEGQTLSEVAVRELPGLPVAEAVAQLQLANNLPSAQVHAGQVLVVPALG